MKTGEAAKSQGIQTAARIRKKAKKRLSSAAPLRDQPCGQLAFSPVIRFWTLNSRTVRQPVLYRTWYK